LKIFKKKVDTAKPTIADLTYNPFKTSKFHILEILLETI